MRVLFISSGNSKAGISPIIKNQGESLRSAGIDIDFYTLVGKGLKGYLSNVPRLRKYLRRNKYDVIHAHYSLVGIIVALAGVRRLIVSLMGSDIYEYAWLRFITRVFSRLFWKVTIVKSEGMKTFLRIKNAIVVPNGVNLKKFRTFSQKEINEKIPSFGKKQVLFIGSPVKKEKNLALAKKAFDKINLDNVEFLPLHGVESELIPYYMNAASVLILTSLWEGSPNVIKEAMACNLPIVSVNVGDVEQVIGNTEGCYIAESNVSELAEKLRLALAFDSRTKGREKVMGLSGELIAKRIINIYKTCAKKSA